MNLRPATEADASRILEVIQTGISENVGGHYSSEQINGWVSGFSIARIQEVIADTYSLVAHLEDAIVGFGNLAVRESDAGEIDLLYVSPHQQRTGVGHLLIDALEQEAARRHFFQITADVSLSARGLFLQMGYSIRKSYIKTHNGIEYPNMWVEKNLNIKEAS
jgi:N-acetylglutamate synthase-like GNAT family acetyltransferase